jgi:hypothetical protein|tara:strand:+ start:2694 stop:2975 length:282 start_codon:yes stop_codon:yes gene_type:complete
MNLGSIIQNFIVNVSKEKFIDEQKTLILVLEYNTIRLFVMTFIILYLISDKIKLTDKEDKPDNYKILLISIIVSLIYLAILSIRIFSNLKLIL